MNAEIQNQIESTDTTTLLPLVCQLLERPDVTGIDWQIEAINEGTFGVVRRFEGQAYRPDGAKQPWSLILKVVHNASDAPLDRSRPSNTRYWKREPLAYQSGFLDDLPGQVVAPRCYAVEERSEEEMWLWLEDVAVTAEAQTEWPLSRYGLAARHLGQFNGAYLAGQPIPDEGWLVRGLLRSLISEAASAMTSLPAIREEPLAKQFFPPDVTAGLLRLWAERDRFLNTLDRLPQTICHREAFRRHLYARGDETVVIDWEDMAIGPVGEELAALVVLSLATGALPTASAQALDEVVFDGYLKGLNDSGWRGKSDLVRLGYTAATLRYALGPTAIFVPLIQDESNRQGLEERTGQPIDKMPALWASIFRFVLSRIDEARRLLKQS